ncbi:MAG: sigma-70 family RNA polymerase sigma factor [Candidatus Eisenbacteria bacterium]
MPSTDPPSPFAGTLDWTQLRQLILQRIRGRLRFTPAETLEDLTQEVLVRMFRLSEREAIDNPEALATTLVHRICVDHVRRMRGPRGRLDPLPEGDGPLELPAPDPGQEISVDMLEMFRFVVIEHFKVNDQPCHELAVDFFTELNWSVVSERLGLKHNTVIKRWSRCMEQVRQTVATQSGPLWDWARNAGMV